ncbi:MAG: hypothetical protein J6S29_05535 [Methanosphaera sp.]|nr:hypothetical protein [Methanosphaera sp.]
MAEEKNLLIALILSAIISGVGNVYNGLGKRGLIELLVAIVLTTAIFPIGLIWWAYVVYDTYVCNIAVNNNQKIPLLLTVFEVND